MSLEMRKFFIVLIDVLFEFSTFAVLKPVVAKADDLVIDDNGSVTLIITDNSVLAAETKKPDTTA